MTFLVGELEVELKIHIFFNYFVYLFLAYIIRLSNLFTNIQNQSQHDPQVGKDTTQNPSWFFVRFRLQGLLIL
ncbi:hypothetical protein Hanom_Chr15g01374461 [Helianthus anomalus]